MSPNVTVNQLPRFYNASPKAKQSIVASRKYPKKDKFGCNMYNSAKAAIGKYLVDEKHDPKVFERVYKTVQERNITSTWTENDKKNTLLAIKILQENVDSIFKNFLSLKAHKPNNEEKSTTYSLLDISLNPDLVFLDNETKNIAGAVKIIFSKNKPITKLEAEFINCLIRKHLEKLYKTPIAPNNCLVFDVFHKRFFIAPSNDFNNYYNTILKSVCKEIISIWDKA